MEEDRTDALLDTTEGGGLLGSFDRAPSFVTVFVVVLLMMLVMVVLASELVKDWLSRVFNDNDDEFNFMLPVVAKLVDDDAPLSDSCEMN